MRLFGKSKEQKINEQLIEQELIKAYNESRILSVHSEHPFNRIVALFSGSAVLQDHLELIRRAVNGLDKKKQVEAKGILEYFEKAINFAGRKKYHKAYSKTEHNEAVNANNVYMGDNFGHSTFTISDLFHKGWGDKNKESTYGDEKISNPYYAQATQIINDFTDLPNQIKKLAKLLGTEI